MATPRGIRNNNPGNLVKSSAAWQGKVVPSTDPVFEQFTSAHYGIRALAKQLIAYQDRHGLTTIRQFITRWAPPHENDTEAYIRIVAKAVGIKAETPFDVHSPVLLETMAAAIIKHENGIQPYSYQDIRAAVYDALDIDEHVPIPTPTPKPAPAKEPAVPMLPILASLLPEIFKLFQPRAQAEIARATGADPAVAAQFMQAVVDKIAGAPVTTEAQAIQAVNNVLAAPADARAVMVKEVEDYALDYIARMRPLIDRIAEIDAEVESRRESSRAAARAFADPEAWKLRWAQATFTQKALAVSIIVEAVLIMGMTVALIWMPQDARSAVINLIGQLVVVLVTTLGAFVNTFRDQNGFSFGGTSDGEARAVARSVAERAK